MKHAVHAAVLGACLVGCSTGSPENFGPTTFEECATLLKANIVNDVYENREEIVLAQEICETLPANDVAMERLRDNCYGTVRFKDYSCPDEDPQSCWEKWKNDPSHRGEECADLWTTPLERMWLTNALDKIFK